MINPIVSVDGSSSEYNSIVNFLKNNENFPNTFIKANINDFYENRALRDFLAFNKENKNKYFS